MELKTLAQKLHNAGFALYTDKTYISAKHNAQLNLADRTHYADDSTLRFFHARILAANDAQNGLLFWIIESVSLDMNNTRRGFRFVPFDLFGEVLERAKLDHAFKTKEQARKAFYKWLDSFNIVAHYAQAIERKAKELEYQASDYRKIFATE